ncbi:hypothetical protein BT93_F0869 [Corymbia citriodora subsp. variegata]|nr:hypothetical protein BT93_F0869 [Corymbia citriodora subsp. variegata]
MSNASLAEAYVMRKLHKEKMKKEKMAAENAGDVRRKEERTASRGGRGRFSLSRVFGGKTHVHPSSAEVPPLAPSE